ncbi:MAG: ABC transporter permease [Castellaniella sp.]
MPAEDRSDLLAWEIHEGTVRLAIRGRWVLSHYEALGERVPLCRAAFAQRLLVGVDTSGLEVLDTAGAARLVELLGGEHLGMLAEGGISAERQAMLDAVARAMQAGDALIPPRRPTMPVELLGTMGAGVLRFWQQFILLLGFSGLVLETLLRNILRPRGWRMTAIVAQIEQTGLDAVPIVALLTFLVGAVITFLGATILSDFGATTYTVSLVGFSFLREFAVLLVAILMAGRTASAFTAQLGSMKVNEEIDAIRVQGLSPVELLVLPRVLALQVSLPILTFVGMIAGIAGGMVVCALSLDITPQMFIDRFGRDIPVRHFLLGMAKAPVFAFLIAVIGCLQGFSVRGSAQSVGEHTTAAVVHSIFVVILLDALAALFYMEMGW